MTRLAIMGIVLIYPFSLFAQNLVEVPFPDMEMFWQALADKNWPIVVGIGLTLVVWIVRKYFFRNIPAKYVPFIVLVLPCVTSIGSRMVQYVTESKPWWQGALQGAFEGAMIGFTAMGAWDVKKSSRRKNADIGSSNA